MRATDPSIRSLILTSFDDEQALMAAVLAGASGYLLKDIRGEQLVADVRKVAAGESLMPENAGTRVIEDIGGSRVNDPRLRSLTPQERRILRRVAEGMTNRQIGDDLFLAEKTVKNYITAILAKLGMERRTQAAVFAVTHADELDS